MVDKLIEALRETREDLTAFLRGDDVPGLSVETFRVPEDVDVKAIREKLEMSQAEFARAFGFNLATLQSWERSKNRRRPTGAARVLLTVLDRKPDAVLDAIACPA